MAVELMNRENLHLKNPLLPRLAQLDKRQSSEREAAGSSPGRTNTQGL